MMPLPLTLLALAVGAAASVTDLRRRVVPNRLTAAGAVAAVAVGAVVDPAGEPARLAAAAGAGGLLLAAALVRPDGMGMGDVKLAAVLGLCLGPPVALAVLAACLAGCAAGTVVAVRHGWRAARAATVPFAPCLALGATVAVLPGLSG